MAQTSDPLEKMARTHMFEVKRPPLLAVELNSFGNDERCRQITLRVLNYAQNR